MDGTEGIDVPTSSVCIKIVSLLALLQMQQGHLIFPQISTLATQSRSLKLQLDLLRPSIDQSINPFVFKSFNIIIPVTVSFDFSKSDSIHLSSSTSEEADNTPSYCAV